MIGWNPAGMPAGSGSDPKKEGLGTAAKLGLGLGALGLGYASARRANYGTENAPPTGYQGTVPDYSLVRERVLDTDNPNRRPGSRGQRYFSDYRFAPTGYVEPVEGGINISRNPTIDALRQQLFEQANVGPDSLRAQNYARVGQTAPELPEGAGPTGIDSVLGFPDDLWGFKADDPTLSPDFTPTDPSQYQVFAGGNIYIPGFGMMNAYDEAAVANFLIWKRSQEESAPPTDDGGSSDPDGDPVDSDGDGIPDDDDEFPDDPNNGQDPNGDPDGDPNGDPDGDPPDDLSSAQRQAEAWAKGQKPGAITTTLFGENGRIVVKNNDGTVSSFLPHELERARAHAAAVRERYDAENPDTTVVEANNWAENAEVGAIYQLSTGRWVVKNRDGSVSGFASEADANTRSRSILDEIEAENVIAARDAEIAAWSNNPNLQAGDYIALANGQYAVLQVSGAIQIVDTEEEARATREGLRKQREGIGEPKSTPPEERGVPLDNDNNNNIQVPDWWPGTAEEYLDYLDSQRRRGGWFHQGGLASLAGGGYLSGNTDGMADQLRTTIEGTQPAALSDGEFVVPADVVSHLGNGNSDAGAEQLYAMMDKIRMDRTGTTEQGREINPNQYMPRGIA